MVRRSVLFTPGDRPGMLRKAPGAGADVNSTLRLTIPDPRAARV
jgi:hypothetical protein